MGHWRMRRNVANPPLPFKTWLLVFLIIIFNCLRLLIEDGSKDGCELAAMSRSRGNAGFPPISCLNRWYPRCKPARIASGDDQPSVRRLSRDRDCPLLSE